MSARDLLLQNLGRVARCTPIPLQHATDTTVKNDPGGEALAHPAEPATVAAAPLYCGEEVARCTPLEMQHATRDSVHNASGGVRATGSATAVQQPAAVPGKAQAQRATARATGVQQEGYDQAADLRRQLHTAQRTGAITRDDLQVALEAIERNRGDPGYLRELRLLVLWCAEARPGPSGAN